MNKMSFFETIASGPVLMEGALGERLKREYGLAIDGPAAMATLVDDPVGRAALTALWQEYLAIAEKYRLPFMATTPTRRANRLRMEKAGLDDALLERNAQLLCGIRNRASTAMFAGGLMGCVGDAYTGQGSLEADEAETVHRWQAKHLAESGLDFLYAGIMPTLPEALGMARAMASTGLPYIISFTICRAGTLIDGTSIDAAIEHIDSHTDQPPALYMTNCVHPSIVYEALSQPMNQTERVAARFKGVQANTAALDYSAMDGAQELITADPETLAEAMLRLCKDKGLSVFGGCCGTDGSHIEAIARRIAGKISE